MVIQLPAGCRERDDEYMAAETGGDDESWPGLGGLARDGIAEVDDPDVVGGRRRAQRWGRVSVDVVGGQDQRCFGPVVIPRLGVLPQTLHLLVAPSHKLQALQLPSGLVYMTARYLRRRRWGERLPG